MKEPCILSIYYFLTFIFFSVTSRVDKLLSGLWWTIFINHQIDLFLTVLLWTFNTRFLPSIFTLFLRIVSFYAVVDGLPCSLRSHLRRHDFCLSHTDMDLLNLNTSLPHSILRLVPATPSLSWPPIAIREYVQEMNASHGPIYKELKASNLKML